MERNDMTKHHGKLIACMTITTLGACAPAVDCLEESDCEAAEGVSVEAGREYVERLLPADIEEALERLARENRSLLQADAALIDPDEVPDLHAEALDQDRPISSSNMRAEVIEWNQLDDSLRRLLDVLDSDATNGQSDQMRAVEQEVVTMALDEECTVRGAVVGGFADGLVQGIAVQNGEANAVGLKGQIYVSQSSSREIFEGDYFGLEGADGSLVADYHKPKLEMEKSYSIFEGDWVEKSMDTHPTEGTIAGVLLGGDTPGQELLVGYWTVCTKSQENLGARNEDDLRGNNTRPDTLQKP